MYPAVVDNNCCLADWHHHQSAIYQYMKHDFLQRSQRVPYIRPLRSAFAEAAGCEPSFTSFTPKKCETIDYIWYSASIVGILPCHSEAAVDWIRAVEVGAHEPMHRIKHRLIREEHRAPSQFGFPGLEHPSDHLPVKVSFDIDLSLITAATATATSTATATATATSSPSPRTASAAAASL
jgi:mRNA deadenylase 3'-5' endonuclease subunit Ccr4